MENVKILTHMGQPVNFGMLPNGIYNETGPPRLYPLAETLEKITKRLRNVQSSGNILDERFFENLAECELTEFEIKKVNR